MSQQRSDATRRSSPTNSALAGGRGRSHRPHSVAASDLPDKSGNETARILALKVELNWANEESRALYNRLRDLGWQAARYRNEYVRAMWAQSKGWRAEPDDKNSASKAIRSSEKGELSGAAYSAAEREATGSWSRDVKKILAGQPLPEWKPNAALSVRGHKNKKDSGVWLEFENDQYVIYLQAQAANTGPRLRIPIAKNTKRDEFQGDVLRSMVQWETPILKATVQIKRRKITIRLTYNRTLVLPRMGKRIATLAVVRDNRLAGPRQEDSSTQFAMLPGRLMLRTEVQQKDYTSKLNNIIQKKDSWDLIRRRVMAQIGWRKGQARAKRMLLARWSWDEWLHSYIHTWSHEMAEWCATQGVGTIRIGPMADGDWPAHKLIEQLRYKAGDKHITVELDASISDKSGERTAKAAVNKESRKVRRRREAMREIGYQLNH